VVVAALKEGDFCQSVDITFSEPPRADVYGVSNDEGNWYVKIQLRTDENLIILSCHPPEFRLKRRDGTWLEPLT
jgi:hypothetical protein